MSNSRRAYGSEPWDGIEVLAADSVSDMERLTVLVSAPGTLCLDQLSEQSIALSGIVPSVDDDLLNEPCRWVYYPWRRAVVRILGPRGFRALRLDRNRNKITSSEQLNFDALSVGVVGLSVGHSIAYALALEGLVGNLSLADFDAIELSNLNRVPATILDLGLNKSVIAARRIVELDPYISISLFEKGITSDSMNDFFSDIDLVVEECDSLDVKLAVREAARARRIPLIMETSDRGLVDVERYDREPGRQLLHGLLGGLTAKDLEGLSNRDKVPHVMRIMDSEGLSPRLAASLVEVEETISTWPRVAEDVHLGTAMVATAVRLFGQGGHLGSGRVRVDIEDALGAIQSPIVREDENVPPTMSIASDAPETAASAILRAVQRAPSGGNSQPWSAAIANGRLSLELDTTNPTGMDIKFRGSAVALGAAMYNAEVAAAAFGVLGEVRIMELKELPYLGISMDLGVGADLSLAAQLDGVLSRETNRNLGNGESLSQLAIDALREVELGSGICLHLFTQKTDIQKLGELLGESDRSRYLTPSLHEQMISELRWPPHDSIETGIDIRSLELDPADLAKLRVASRGDVMAQLRDWGGGRALGDDTRDRVRSSSALCAVSLGGNQLADYVRGGRAVERLWIAAESAGLAVQPMSPVFLYANEPAEFPADILGGQDVLWRLRDSFFSLAGIPRDRSIALLLRLSYARRGSVRSQRRT